MTCFGSPQYAYDKTLRFSTVEDIPEYYFKENKTIIGKVVAVHDGDGFRLFHEEENGLISCFSPKKAAFTRGMNLKASTLNIRLAGIDAPEIGKDGNSGQPFSEESKLRLKKLVQGNTIKLKLLQRDQYGRAVALVLIPKFFILKQDVSLKLLDEGLAVVYRGKDACYGSEENKKLYNTAELKAKRNKSGIWSQSKIETPGEYKKSAKNKT